MQKLKLKINQVGFIDFKNVSWTRKKSFDEYLNLNDIIYVKKIKKNKWNLKQLPKINGAIVVMDPHTGRVLLWLGGFSFKLSEFNRATQAKRQPGSAFKPIVYAAALENGFTPSTLILDAPFVIEQGKGLKTWKPENYGKNILWTFNFENRYRKIQKFNDSKSSSSKLGFDRNFKNYQISLVYITIFRNYYPSALGSAETTLVIQLTNSYCAFVNGGKKS